MNIFRACRSPVRRVNEKMVECEANGPDQKIKHKSQPKTFHLLPLFCVGVIRHDSPLQPNRLLGRDARLRDRTREIALDVEATESLSKTVLSRRLYFDFRTPRNQFPVRLAFP